MMCLAMLNRVIKHIIFLDLELSDKSNLYEYTRISSKEIAFQTTE